jgi:hypothetical protein
MVPKRTPSRRRAASTADAILQKYSRNLDEDEDEEYNDADARRAGRTSKARERPFVCDDINCAKAFARRSDLIRHKRIHANDRSVLLLPTLFLDDAAAY